MCQQYSSVIFPISQPNSFFIYFTEQSSSISDSEPENDDHQVSGCEPFASEQEIIMIVWVILLLLLDNRLATLTKRQVKLLLQKIWKGRKNV